MILSNDIAASFSVNGTKLEVRVAYLAGNSQQLYLLTREGNDGQGFSTPEAVAYYTTEEKIFPKNREEAIAYFRTIIAY